MIYDPLLKKDMGVVYTPDQIVRFIVNSIDYFLVKKFKIKKGILDESIKYLDPAAGTMAFPCWLLSLARDKIDCEIDANPDSKEELKQERYDFWFHNAFLKNVFGFEILMAPYVLGHLRVLMTAEENGASINYKQDKASLFLMNTLMEDSYLVLNPKIESEIHKGLDVRHNKEIIVVMGNPPYNISSQNNTSWIMDKTDEYVSPDAMEREEGKSKIKKITGLKSMKDDYIKFIRFAQWKIAEKSGQGIVGLITNNFFLEGVAARGMRKTLRKYFDEIWIIDFHSDWKREIPKKIQQQGITNDENVFEGIGLGVAISFFIHYPPGEHKKNKQKDPLNCIVKYAEKWGTRLSYEDSSGNLIEGKLDFLKNNSISTINFIEIGERLDFEFTPDLVDDESKSEYNSFAYLCSIFIRNIQGVVTAHDTLVSNTSRERLEQILQNFYDGTYEAKEEDDVYKNREKEVTSGRKYDDGEVSYNDARDFQLIVARKGDPKQNIEQAKKAIIKWQYRGFDTRFLAYYKPLLNKGTERSTLMQYLLPHQQNITLIVNRLTHKDSEYWSSCFISRYPADGGCMEGASSGGASYVFPLKINLSKEPDDLFHPKPAIHSNINADFKDQLPYQPTDEDIFYYIHGILWTPKYRLKYKTFFKNDFPRIPFPKNLARLKQMAEKGKILADLHLLASDLINLDDCPYNLAVDDEEHRKVKTIEYDSKRNRIYFDKLKKNDPEDLFWIGGITEDIWKFEMGGKQQIKEWLSARRYIDPSTPRKNYITNPLQHNNDDLNYLRKMVSAIKHTILIQYGNPQDSNEESLNDIFELIMADLYGFDVNRLNAIMEKINNSTRSEIKSGNLLKYFKK